MGVYEESLGQTFGQLTVTELLGRAGKYHHRVKVICSCGTEKTALLADLRAGRTKTCRMPGKHLSKGGAAFQAIYRDSYKFRARQKGLAFELSEEQFRNLSQMNCHYCDAKPSGTSKSRYDVFVYNGLDRKDSAQGYILDNVVPCCSICNHAKHTMSYDTFCAWLDRIAATRAKRELHMIEL